MGMEETQKLGETKQEEVQTREVDQKQDAEQAQEEIQASPKQEETPQQNAAQSERMAGKWFLIPIISEHENEPVFIEKVKDASKIILAYVVDPEKMGNVKTAEVGEHLGKIRKIMGEIGTAVAAASLTAVVEEVIEWGNWEEKLVNIAAMEKTDEVVFYNSALSQNLANKLKEKGLTVTII